MSDAAVTTAPPSSGILGDSGSSSLSPSPSALQALAVPPIHPLGDPLAKRDRKRRQVKPPKDSKVYKAVLATIALKAQGLKNSEISEILKYSPTTIKTYLARAHRKGWINLESFDDPEDQLEVVLKSKTVRNINTVLDERNEEDGSLTNRAVDVSMQVAKGTGLLKHHEVVKTDQQTNVGVALRVQVEYPAQSQGAMTVPRPDAIGSAPSIDAEFVTKE